MIIKLLLISIGGFIGAICRYKLSLLLNSKKSGTIPLGTLFVNLTGSFLLGLILGLDSSENAHLLFGTGFMGAFTTFSTFNLEAVKLLQSNAKQRAVFYILSTYIFGITLAFIGYYIGKII
ncbi:fluoride efflux transporter CrcB [Bacillus sp. S/N-304-OC-R1]|uniref:fluoride efflux transporter CrcB n=1 Tax=Bacillus sp. S/N-304-OC-R1 TaxID=2758034 RepID=UPI001C8D1E3C|nr:fluoride efflux transporter CrcB [Bacillus sp. S/N-304-OC-R1]MBY0120379.1 fluoride efflux transporter CrcB [Bacillus sp. S/N-304-OC-R1]